MGTVRPQAVAAMDPKTGHLARRLGARNAALSGTGRGDGNRGWLRPRGIGRASAERSRRGVAPYEALRVPRTRRAVLGSRERAKLNHLPSRWARLKRDLEYAARSVLYPDGTAHRVAWLYGYDVMAEEHYRLAEAA